MPKLWVYSCYLVKYICPHKRPTQPTLDCTNRKPIGYNDLSLSKLSSIGSWLNPLFRIGYKRSLEGEDLDDVLPEYRSRILGETLQRCVCVCLCVKLNIYFFIFKNLLLIIVIFSLKLSETTGKKFKKKRNLTNICDFEGLYLFVKKSTF